MSDEFNVDLLKKIGPFSVIFALFVLLIVFFKCITVIPAGHVGVKHLFGKVQEKPLTAGMHIVNPLLKIIKMSVQTRELTEPASVPSKEGLVVSLDVSLLYHLEPQSAPKIYEEVGINYVRVIVEPQMRSMIRSVTSGFEAKALYTAEREKIATEMLKMITLALADNGIVAEKILLRNVTLPQTLSDAIENKLKREQEFQQMQFVIKKEEKEAERKKIEARGIRDFQRIVAQGISPNLLKWKGIEATEKLAGSSNTKVIIIGNAKDGLPIILGGM